MPRRWRHNCAMGASCPRGWWAWTSSRGSRSCSSRAKGRGPSRPSATPAISGRAHALAPWLGLITSAGDGGIVVDGFNDAGPARGAGFRRGDRVVGVDGVRVATQEEFYERLWRRRAGDTIKVAVRRGGDERVIPVRSMDRYTLYRTT